MRNVLYKEEYDVGSGVSCLASPGIAVSFVDVFFFSVPGGSMAPVPGRGHGVQPPQGRFQLIHNIFERR